MASMRCRVCSAFSLYAHFGVDSCRSCAEFYKRAVHAGLVIPCRKGDGKCTITENNRRNCRGCRFKKCQSIGMKLAETKAKDDDVCPTLAPRQPRQIIACRNDKLMALIAKEHAVSVHRRRICESTLLPISLHRHVKAENTNMLLCEGSFLKECQRLFSGDYVNFAAACFPEFAALPLEEKRGMLKSFTDRLFTVERLHDTVRTFGSTRGPLYMATLTTCFDSRNLELLSVDKSHESSNPIAILFTFNNEMILTKSSFTDLEYSAIFALSIWQIDSKVPEHLTYLCVAMRQRIYGALEEYYREELRLHDCSARLNAILAIERAFQNARLACTNCNAVTAMR